VDLLLGDIVETALADTPRTSVKYYELTTHHGLDVQHIRRCCQRWTSDHWRDSFLHDSLAYRLVPPVLRSWLDDQGDRSRYVSRRLVLSM
jgi:hypothetical protein